MEYAIQLLLPILGGLLLGFWLTENYGVSPIWTVVLAILGMVGGIGILYKRFSYPHLYPDSKSPSADNSSAVQPHRTAQPKTGAIQISKLEAPTEPSTGKSIPIEQLEFLYEEPDHERNRKEFDLNLDDEQPENGKPEKELE
jgi:hypothetical protein